MTEEIKKKNEEEVSDDVVVETSPAEPTDPEEKDPIEEPNEGDGNQETEPVDGEGDNNSEPVDGEGNENSPTDYSAEIASLKASLEEAQQAYDALKTETDSLREFKLSIEKKEKENMIAGFYMLNDEDKKDVVDNIDKYSLDEIEAKLSVICVRNKVNFSLDNETEEPNKQEFTFNLDTAVENNNEEIPEWIKAVQETAHEMY